MTNSADDERTSHAATERMLRDALRARARSAVGDMHTVPPLNAPEPRRSHLSWALPLAAAVVVAAVAVTVTVAIRGSSTNGRGELGAPAGSISSPAGTGAPSMTTSAPPTPSTGGATTSAPVIPPARAHGRVVTVSSDIGDGATVGVGEPIVLNFSPTPTDSQAFTHAVTVSVNGTPATGAWYWERPYRGEPVQAHYRELGYWPANASITVNLPIRGLSAGRGLIYSGKLSSISFRTGDAHVSTVDFSTLNMQVTDNGHVVKNIPVSLGAAQTPTTNGVKVVMQKGEDAPGTSTLRPDGAVEMVGPGYDEIVDWSVRVTADGEYVHAAPWNSEIGRQSTSNGCTNLSTANAKWFYGFSQLGDVVRYVNTDGKPMNPLDGLGDWNIPWVQWQAGGLLLNH